MKFVLFVDDVYSVLKCTCLENFFHLINNLQNIKFTMEEKSNGELVFLDTLLKWNNGDISVLVYRKPTYTDQYLHCSSHHQTSSKETVVSSLCNRICSINTNKELFPTCVIEYIPLILMKMTYTKKTLE